LANRAQAAKTQAYTRKMFREKEEKAPKNVGKPSGGVVTRHTGAN